MLLHGSISDIRILGAIILFVINLSSIEMLHKRDSVVLMLSYEPHWFEQNAQLFMTHIRVNCGMTYGSWISCDILIKYGTHKHVTYVVMSWHINVSSTAHTAVKYSTHKHIMYIVMSMTGHGLIIYRVRTCHVQGYVRSYVTKNAYDVL